MSTSARTFMIGELAATLGGRLVGDPVRPVRGVGALDEAGPDEITFIADAAHAKRWADARAGAAVVSEGLAPRSGPDDGGRALIFVADAELALATILDLFGPAAPLPPPGVHASAWVHPSAEIGPGARVGPQVTVDGGCRVGAEVVLHPGVRLYPGVTIGEASVIHANCVVRERTIIGRRVILHQNVSIGSDGFGYRPSRDGSGLVKMPHIGNVVIEDDVEIGAGTCVDRAKFGSTVIGAGTKIDNLVQIAHNCRIGRSCVIAGLSGVAGSCVIGDGAMLGGAAGISDHLRIGRGARIAARSGVMNDVPDGESWAGTPACRSRDTLRQIAALRRLPGLMHRISSRLDDGAPKPPDEAASD
jgi:UDP-3-O-[3-hydroxymyristoyl] glucosamine N-acyltransferase